MWLSLKRHVLPAVVLARPAVLCAGRADARPALRRQHMASLACLGPARTPPRRHRVLLHAAASASASSSPAGAPASDAAKPKAVKSARAPPAAGGSAAGGAALPATVDYTTMVAAVAECKALAVPARVQSVTLADENTLVLGLRTLESKAWLHLSWHVQAARACLGPPPPLRPDTDAFSFRDVLKASLVGQNLIDAAMLQPWERVARFSFGARLGEPPERELFLEVMGNYSNLLLADGGGVLLGAAYQVGAKQSRVRSLAAGHPYEPPPPQGGIFPAAGQAEGEWRETLERAAQLPRAKGDVAGAMVRAYAGVSPQLARELLGAAGLPADAQAPALTPEQWSALHAVWLRWLGALAAGDFAPGLCAATGSFSVLGGSPPAAQAPAALLEAWVPPEGAGPIGGMLSAHFGAFAAGERFRRLRERLLAGVKAAQKKVTGKVFSFKQALAAAEGADKVRYTADLLMSQLHLAKPGASSVTVTDWETGEPVEIAVDAQEGALSSAQALYAKAKKLKRSVSTVTPLLSEAEDELAYLAEVETQLLCLEGGEAEEGGEAGAGGGRAMAALREVEAELADGKYVRLSAEVEVAEKKAARGGGKGGKGGKKGAAGAGAEPGDAAPGVRKLESPSGWPVFVGRNSRGNETVSHVLARDTDVWFHLRGLPGAHVLLRVPPGKVAPDADLQFAADLAAFFSKERDAPKAAVSYTSPKHIRRPPGGGRPGMVLMSKEDGVITARPAAVAEAARKAGA